LTRFEQVFIITFRSLVTHLASRHFAAPTRKRVGLSKMQADGTAADMIQLSPIGVVHSHFVQQKGTPIQPRWAKASEGTVELRPEFATGLRDLAGFDRIWLLYWFDRARSASLDVVPYLDTQSRGYFPRELPRGLTPSAFPA
jgi:hypothetical protein